MGFDMGKKIPQGKGVAYTLRSTLPERRQRVHTFIFLGAPFTNTCTVCMLGAQVRLVLRLEWLTLLPDITPLLHTSQYLPMLSTSLPYTSGRFKSQTYLFYHVPRINARRICRKTPGFCRGH